MNLIEAAKKMSFRRGDSVGVILLLVLILVLMFPVARFWPWR